MEVLLKNVTVIDGTGAPAYQGSIGFEHGKLRIFREQGPAVTAETVVDGTGLTACPGFIDAHSHGDLNILSDYATASKITQGITTQVAGQCGYSMFPCNYSDAASYERYIAGVSTHPDFPQDVSVTCRSAGPWLDWVHGSGSPLTTFPLVGHGALRLWAMGYEQRKPDATELKRMKDMLRQCMREGAIGLSTGLVYAPCCYAEDDEIISLLEVVREEGGYYATHPRNEADYTVEAVQGSIDTAKAAGVPLCISHLKAAGRDNWGKPHIILENIRKAREQDGMRIMMDCYPYMAGNTALNVSIPPRYFKHGLSGLVEALKDPVEREVIREEISRKSDYENYILNCGGFSGVYVSSSPIDHSAEGKFIDAYAKELGIDPFDAYCDILIKNGGLSLAIYFHMCEDDVAEILSDPWCAVGTDGLLGLPTENPHPRTFGTMPRAFHFLTDEKHLMTPEAAIHKITGLPAEFLRLPGKGKLVDGYDADVLLIDMAGFRDTSSYAHGSSRAEGIIKVYTGGQEVDLERYRKA